MLHCNAYTIRSGLWVAEIAPELGANIVSLRYGGQDILRPWSKNITDPFLAGAPLLLPANRTAGGQFSFEGHTYLLPINDTYSQTHLHGTLHDQTFQVTEQGPAHICLAYENQGEVYPFPFRITVCYRLSCEGLQTHYTIENPAGAPMPLTFGVHTTFPEPDWFCVPLAACQEKDNRHIPTGRYIPLNPQEACYCTGSSSRDRNISGFYLAAGDTARIGDRICYQAEGFDHWILYNGKGTGGFLCMEPQLGGVNALNDAQNCPVLRENEVLHLKTRLFFSPHTEKK